VLTCSDSSN